MNKLNQTYKELAVPYFKETFYFIDEVMKAKGHPYYLIGSSAIALELLKEGVKPSRGTKDIDFAVMLSSINEYEEVVEELVKRGFTKVKAPWTLYHSEYNVAIDLLPYGQIAQNDTIQFNERYSDLHVIGLEEVLKETIKIPIEEKIAQIPPLPGIVLLKLVAWSDRPEKRGDDLADTLHIIKAYFEYEWDDIVENHNDIFPDTEELDQLKVSARVLGRKARTYLEQSKVLEERIIKVLDENLIEIENSIIAKEWAKLNNCDVIYAHSILEELKVGLIE